MQDKIARIAAELFQLDVEAVKLDLTPDDVAAWDSLNHLKLITAVESEFSIRLTMNQIRKIESLADLAEAASETGAP